VIDTAVHAVALRLSAGSTAATINITCHAAANAFFSALMLASLDGRFGDISDPAAERSGRLRAHPH